MSSRPLGRDGEGLSGGLGEGPLSVAVFVPAKAGLFERPKAAFFTVAADGVMRRMTLGMVVEVLLLGTSTSSSNSVGVAIS